MSRLIPQRRFSPSRTLLASAICMASMAHAVAEEAVKPKDGAQSTVMELGATEVSSDRLGSTTEGSRSYTTGAMATATKLPLTMRETPQAVTVITRQRMDDQAMTSINDVVKATPGLFLNFSSGPGRQTYTARGFDIDNIMYDGIPAVTRAGRPGCSQTWRCSTGLK